MRVETLPIILGVIVALLGVALLADGQLPDGTIVSVERRRRPRVERNRAGERLIGLGTLGMAAARARRRAGQVPAPPYPARGSGGQGPGGLPPSAVPAVRGRTGVRTAAVRAVEAPARTQPGRQWVGRGSRVRRTTGPEVKLVAARTSEVTRGPAVWCEWIAVLARGQRANGRAVRTGDGTRGPGWLVLVDRDAWPASQWTGGADW